MSKEKKVSIRQAQKSDVEKLAALVVRLKKLNEEFDPLLKVRSDAYEVALKDYDEILTREDYLVLVCEYNSEVVGVLRAHVRERRYYEPRIEGVIEDFYIMPEHRRKRLGREMVKIASEELKKRGAGLIVAEFPFQNKIASDFYQKLGFRAVIGIFGREE
ncbi:GNAT family N-acetyltransferase [Candidatus Marsarchaeota G2 archaeon ECH_B_SAG-G16]|jgi:ribosomal protein S18 acetylase RimI-like enzyme|uniref:GNAT family N-acetyltransferase n=4 Tax=Candidatus Marsarchaeota TaxID=1978152 RepID=A0A2R6AJV6_9ARCH|nr:MAG: GNAT family N-acetyltransferase [Candidatus Marsarchaeota G1 archaeon OSP_D]PSN86647.1 MAG: GNAT family N-acetyltransferase [Candidatus Marsarchaeota G1 archaeon BE_D]PSN89082.1 MAG: GNAT family N-acetyltransferase [Candidatus Marsarchaeota G1 archaeon OSP_C]PSO04404.1 MAG: GNAT family N-acetyltransferase [Candidatus Marsarchaeota G2 archaeon ECH_B_SAG-G16]